jgi:hypothetical protein
VDKAVNVPRRKHKAASELKWIFAQTMLAHANGFGALAGADVVWAQKMKQVGLLEAQSLIRLVLIIDEKREGNAGLLAEVAGITHIAQADSGHPSPFLAKLLFEFAQLRHVLTAEDSTVMAQENDDCRSITP